MGAGAGAKRVIYYDFLPGFVGCDDEPMLIVVVDEEDELFIVGVVFSEVALVVEKDSSFGVSKEAGAVISVPVVVVRSLDLF